MSPKMKRSTCRESRPRYRLMGPGLRARFLNEKVTNGIRRGGYKANGGRADKEQRKSVMCDAISGDSIPRSYKVVRLELEEKRIGLPGTLLESLRYFNSQ